MQFFHARLANFLGFSRTIHRVYVTDTDLLFVHLDIGTLRPEDYVPQAAAASGGGLLPGLIATGVGHYVAARARDRLNHLTRSLEAADEDVLREYVAEDDKSFLLPLDEVRNVRFKPKPFWKGLFCKDLVALLQLSSLSRGETTLGLIATNEMAGVLEQLRGVFRDVECNLSWRAF